MIASAATQGDVRIEGVIPKHLDGFAKLLEMGMKWKKVTIMSGSGDGRPRRQMENRYPGFPTVFNSRYRYC